MLDRIKKLNQILDQIVLSKVTQEEKTIVIGNIRGNPFYLALDYAYATIFSKLGFRVYIVVDDGQLLHHDHLRMTQASFEHLSKLDNQREMQIKGMISQLWPDAIGPEKGKNKVAFLLYSEFIKNRPDEMLLSDAFREMKQGNVSKNIVSSHRRYFGGREFNPLNKQHVEYAKLTIQNELINEQAGNYMAKELKADLYMTLDGTYTTCAPQVDIMKANHLPVLIYQPNGFFDRSISIGEECLGLCNISNHWNKFITNHYTPTIQNEARAFMDNRLQLKANAGREADQKWIDLLREKKQNNKKIVALFPNLTWDGAFKERDTVFDSLGHWLKETVEWVRERDDILLVIREHPQAKHAYSAYESSLSLLKEILPDVDRYENVIQINGRQTVNSYQLIRGVVDCSVVFNGTLGIEIPHMGEPVILAANSPYSHKGVAYEPDSKAAYFDYLLKVGRNEDDFRARKKEMQENALRAAAYQFIHNSYYCPVMPTLEAFRSSNRYWQDWDLNLKSLDPAANKAWQKTIRRFIEPLVGDVTITRKTNVASKVFTTAYGREIPFFDGYVSSHQQKTARDILPRYRKPVPYKKQGMGFEAFVKDFFEYAIMMDFLESLGKTGPWDAALDIGGAEGTISCLLKGEGKANAASCMEIMDLSRALNENRFVNLFMRYKGMAATGRHYPQIKDALIGKNSNNFGYYPPPASVFWRYELKNQPVFNKYVLGDLYGLKAKFDFITVFLCLEHFDLENLFLKIYSLLNKGGLFCFLTSYWWWPVNSTEIVGDFPYACQRLTRDDLTKYFEENYPEKTADVMERYDYYHLGKQHPTLNDMVDIANRSELQILGTRRMMPQEDSHLRTAIPPKRMMREDKSLIFDALEDIQQFKPDVQLIDMHTAFVLAVFEKPG